MIDQTRRQLLSATDPALERRLPAIGRAPSPAQGACGPTSVRWLRDAGGRAAAPSGCGGGGSASNLDTTVTMARHTVPRAPVARPPGGTSHIPRFGTLSPPWTEPTGDDGALLAALEAAHLDLSQLSTDGISTAQRALDRTMLLATDAASAAHRHRAFDPSHRGPMSPVPAWEATLLDPCPMAMDYVMKQQVKLGFPAGKPGTKPLSPWCVAGYAHSLEVYGAKLPGVNLGEIQLGCLLAFHFCVWSRLVWKSKAFNLGWAKAHGWNSLEAAMNYMVTGGGTGSGVYDYDFGKPETWAFLPKYVLPIDSLRPWFGLDRGQYSMFWLLSLGFWAAAATADANVYSTTKCTDDKFWTL